MKFIFLSLLVTVFSPASANPVNDHGLASRIEAAARRALELRSDQSALSELVNTPPEHRIDFVLHVRFKPVAQMLLLDQLSIYDCIQLMRLKLNTLSGDPTTIDEITKFYLRVIDRVNHRAEWGAVSLQVALAQRAFGQMANLPNDNTVQRMAMGMTAENSSQILQDRMRLFSEDLDMGVVRRLWSRTAARCHNLLARN